MFQCGNYVPVRASNRIRDTQNTEARERLDTRVRFGRTDEDGGETRFAASRDGNDVARHRANYPLQHIGSVTLNRARLYAKQNDGTRTVFRNDRYAIQRPTAPYRTGPVRLPRVLRTIPFRVIALDVPISQKVRAFAADTEGRSNDSRD